MNTYNFFDEYPYGNDYYYDPFDYYDYYDPFGGSEFSSEIFLGILSIIGLILVFTIGIGIAIYIFRSIGLYTLAKNRGNKHAWLAWIPVAKDYLLGDLINDDVAIGNLHIPYAKVLLPIIPVALGIFSVFIVFILPYLGILIAILVGIAVSFYRYAALFWLYRIYAKDHAVAFLVLSIFFPVEAFFVFSIRNHPADAECHPVLPTARAYSAKSILSLVLGITSIFSGVFSGGLFVAISGIIFGAISMKELKLLGKPTGLPLAGLITSIASIALYFITIFVIAFLLFTYGFMGFNESMFNFAPMDGPMFHYSSPIY